MRRLIPFAVYLIFIAIALAILTTDLKNYTFGPNDGASLLCSYFTTEILHPGIQNALACTYDHQPAYFYLLKFFRWVTNENLNALKLIHVLIWTSCVFLIFQLARKRGVSFIISFVGSVYLLTAPLFLMQSLQIRMYILYLMFVLVLFWFRDQSSLDKAKPRILGILGYFTYLFVLLALGIWDGMDVVRERGRNLFTKIKLNGVLIALVAVKLYFVYYHRFIRRGTGIWYKKHDLWKHFNEMFLPVIGWPDLPIIFDSYSIIGIVLLLSLVFFLGFEYRRVSERNRDHLIFCLISWVIIVFFRFVINIDEIEYRYILYVTPILILVSMDSLMRKNRIIKGIAFCLAAIGIWANVTWIRAHFSPGPELMLPHKTLNDLLKKYKPAQLYTFDEFTISNYVMSYQNFLYQNYTPVLEFNENSAPYFLQGTSYALIDMFPEKAYESKLEEIQKKTGYSFESLGCADFGHPKVCLYRVEGNKQLDNLSNEEIRKYLMPMVSP